MHKRMMMASRKVRCGLAELEARGVKKTPKLTRMLDHLYQSQCNDAYWHGVFGGLYLPHLRTGSLRAGDPGGVSGGQLLNSRVPGPGARGQGKEKEHAPAGWRSRRATLTRTGARRSC